MKQHIFNDFSEFADFIQNNENELNNTVIKSFFSAVKAARSTNCGMCKRKNIAIAEDLYKKLCNLLNDEDKSKIKEILKVEEVKFYYNGSPMFNF